MCRNCKCSLWKEKFWNKLRLDGCLIGSSLKFSLYKYWMHYVVLRLEIRMFLQTSSSLTNVVHVTCGSEGINTCKQTSLRNTYAFVKPSGTPVTGGCDLSTKPGFHFSKVVRFSPSGGRSRRASGRSSPSNTSAIVRLRMESVRARRSITIFDLGRHSPELAAAIEGPRDNRPLALPAGGRLDCEVSCSNGRQAMPVSAAEGVCQWAATARQPAAASRGPLALGEGDGIVSLSQFYFFLILHRIWSINRIFSFYCNYKLIGVQHI